MAAGNRFKPRVFTSLSMAVFGFMLASTGIICYVKPPSRIAEWVWWRLLGVEKSTWEALHTIFACLFVVAAITHITYNRKALWSYLKIRFERGREHWRELGLAVVLAALFATATLLNIFPARPIIALSEQLSEGWGKEGQAPPIARIEKFPLETYCRFVEIDLQAALRGLEAAGLTGVSAGTPVRDIARQNDVPPIEIARLLERWATPD